MNNKKITDKKVKVGFLSKENRYSWTGSLLRRVERYRWLFIMSALGFLIGLGGIFLMQKYYANRELKGRTALWMTEVRLKRIDAKDDAQCKLLLEGNAEEEGLLGIIKKYGNTPAGHLARFYVASIFFERGEYEQAIAYLRAFNQPKTFMQSRVFCLLGDAYMSLKDDQQALSHYEKAIQKEKNMHLKSLFIFKKANLYEARGELLKAKECYKKVCKELPKSIFYIQALKHKSRLETMIQAK